MDNLGNTTKENLRVLGCKYFFSLETKLRFFLNNSQLWCNIGRHVAPHVKMYP